MDKLRKEEFQLLLDLIQDCRSIDNTSHILERLQRITDAAKTLDKADLKAARPSFTDFLKEQLNSDNNEANDIIGQLKERMKGMDSYLHKKELDQLQCYVGEIECGISGKAEAIAFLSLVPVGKYDGDRRKYMTLVMDATK